MLALEGQCSDSKVIKYKEARFNMQVSSQLTAIIPPRNYIRKKTCPMQSSNFSFLFTMSSSLVKGRLIYFVPIYI